MNRIPSCLLVLSFLLVTACSNSGGSGSKNNNDGYRGNGPRGPQSQTAKMPVDWDSVPSKFHPEIYEEDFDVNDLSHIDMNVLGILNEVSVKLTSNSSSIGKLKVYRVWAKSATFGRIEVNASFNKLKVRNYTGNQPYSCSKRIANRKLVSLEGGCNLFVEIILPASSEIEVYSDERLVSNRYFPMSLEQLMDDIGRGFNKDKLEVIENFLVSYKQTRKKPKITSFELEEILKEFSFADKYKFSALKKLYVYVTDREGLAEAIENSFTFNSDQEKARRIVGL